MLVPKLRFKREDGTDYPEWEEKKLQDVFVERNETQTITEDAPLLSFTIEQGVINPEDKKTNKRDFLIKDKANKKYSLTEYNDIIYNPANLKFGAIHRNKLGRGVVSPIYAIFYTSENPVFMEYVVTNPVFIKKSLKYLEGTVIKLMTLKPRDFLLMKVCIPCLEEQQKIADFLSTVDEIIAQSEKEVQNLEQQKKAVMQKIFSQEVRFKREDGMDYPEWKMKKLGEIGKAISGSGFSEKYQGHTDLPIPFYKVSDMNNNGNEIMMCNSNNYVSEELLSQMGLKACQQNAIIFAKVGAALMLDRKRIANKPFLVDNNMMIYIPMTNNELEYIYHWFTSIRLSKYAQVGALPSLNASDIECVNIHLPCLEEQQKIADFLSAFDETISYAKQELEKWRELKKGLLQQMFV